jgi:hypothetical protein
MEKVEKNENLMDTFYEIMHEDTDIPPVFIKAAGYWILSSTLGVFTPIEQLIPPSNRPNLYFILSSLPGITRRSTLIRAATNVYKTAWVAYFEKAGITDETIIDDVVEKKILERFTIQGMADHIGDTVADNKTKDYTIISDEFGSILKQKKTDTYLSNMLNMLASLYYGEPFRETLSGRQGKQTQRRIPEGVYMTLLASMQNPDEYLSESLLAQGFLRRTMIIYVHPKDLDPTNYKEYLRIHTIDRPKKINELGKKIGNIIHIFANENINMFMDGLTCKKTNENAKKLYKKIIEKENSEKEQLMQSRAEHLLKLAALEAISANYSEIATFKDNVIPINTNHFNRASKFIELADKRIDVILEATTTPIQKTPAQSDKKEFMRILSKFNEENTENGLIGTGKICSVLGKTKMNLKPLLITLVETDEIKAYLRTPIMKKQGLRQRFMFSLFETKIQTEREEYTLQILSSKQLEAWW